MLVSRRYSQRGEDQDKDEDVIDAERLLQQIACQELERHIWPLPEQNQPIEEQGQHNPGNAPDDCFSKRDDMGLAIEDAKVQRQHPQHTYIEDDPEPETACTHDLPP